MNAVRHAQSPGLDDGDGCGSALITAVHRPWHAPATKEIRQSDTNRKEKKTMQMHPNQFPEHRRNEPTRQAELRVYNELQNSNLAGVGIYGGRPSPDCPEIDFAVLLQGRARLAHEVKGGLYTVERAQWMLHGEGGPKEVGSPVIQARDAAIGLRQAIKENLRRSVYVYATLGFTDMEPDNHILAEARLQKVHVVWRGESLADRLIEISESQRIFVPPTAADIQDEGRLFVPGLEYLGGNAPEAEMEMDARQMFTLNVQNLTIHITVGADGTVGHNPPGQE